MSENKNEIENVVNEFTEGIINEVLQKMEIDDVMNNNEDVKKAPENRETSVSETINQIEKNPKTLQDKCKKLSTIFDSRFSNIVFFSV